MRKVIHAALKVFVWLMLGAMLVISVLLSAALWEVEGWQVGLPVLACLLILWLDIWSTP